MGKQGYCFWIAQEVFAAREALLTMLEYRDKLLYVEAQELRREYMTKIGSFEEEVLEQELNTALLSRKIELIQKAINRREPVDMVAIDQQIEKERSEKLAELENADMTAKEAPSLTDEEQVELQRLYRAIVRDFHPQLNTDISETQRELYSKALDAYKRQNIDALRLIYNMLYDEDGLMSIVPTQIEQEKVTEDEAKKAVNELSDKLATDYSLAATLFSYFKPLESDRVLLSAREKYTNERRHVDDEIQTILKSFPFNAKDTLCNEDKTAEYIGELKLRLKRASADADSLTNRIEQMTEATHCG